MSDKNVSYEICPECNGTGLVKDGYGGGDIICPYCNGNGVVAFIDKVEEVYSDVTYSEKNPLNRITLYFIAFTLIITLENLIISLFRTAIRYFTDILPILGWGSIFGIITAALTSIMLYYIPILTGAADRKGSKLYIKDERKFNAIFNYLPIFLLTIVIVTVPIALPVIFFLPPAVSSLTAVLMGVEYYPKKAANIIISVLLLVSALLCGIAVYFIINLKLGS